MPWQRSAPSRNWRQRLRDESGSAVAATVLLTPWVVSAILIGIDVSNMAMSRSGLQVAVMNAARASAVVPIAATNTATGFAQGSAAVNTTNAATGPRSGNMFDTATTAATVRARAVVINAFPHAEVAVRIKSIAGIPCVEVHARMSVAGLVVGSRTLDAVGHAPLEIP
jgi:Flp pilus assembly protein TadG